MYSVSGQKCLIISNMWIDFVRANISHIEQSNVSQKFGINKAASTKCSTHMKVKLLCACFGCTDIVQGMENECKDG